jgi:hypothetical protein
MLLVEDSLQGFGSGDNFNGSNNLVFCTKFCSMGGTVSSLASIAEDTEKKLRKK